LLQYGAIPYRRVDGEVQFLMITSRRTGRWIFPKGGPIAGLSPAETAAEETFEEAGVRGTVAAMAIGRYHAIKPGPGGGTPISVEMYAIEVKKQFDDWPEVSERRRQWATLAEARLQLSEPALIVMAEKIVGDRAGDAASQARDEP
jgi:8-oxo-dGTP pyrophosphatase MutT (NUDIX family)